MDDQASAAQTLIDRAREAGFEPIGQCLPSRCSMQGTGRDSAAMLLVFDLAALGVGDVQLPEGKQGLKVQLQTRVDA